MKNNIPEITIDMPGISNLHIILNGRHYTLTPVAEAPADGNQTTLSDFIARQTAEMQRQGRIRTAQMYRTALNSIMRYLDHREISFNDMNATLIGNYEQYLKNKGLVSNTTSFYMRLWRRIYNQAVAEGLTVDRQPFAHVYTGMGKTTKRAIPLEDIRRIEQVALTSPQELLTRDLFLFSLYTRGMSFIDIAYLTPQNIRNGVLTYRRKKTGQQLSMRWEEQMQEIVDRYPKYPGGYLLPVIKKQGNERAQYQQGQRVVNAVLKSIAQKAGIKTKLTMYVARHSWASLAHAMDTPVNIISDGMGHNSEHTTQIYLAALDANRLDNINASIIQAVTQP